MTSAGFANASQSITITDSDGTGHNPNIPEDVNGDNAVSPIDALLIINYLNSNGPGAVPSGTGAPFLDVNADGFVTSIDALIVINRLNTSGGEGELATAEPAAGAGTSTSSSESAFDLDSIRARRKTGAVDDFFANF